MALYQGMVLTCFLLHLFHLFSLVLSLSFSEFVRDNQLFIFSHSIDGISSRESILVDASWHLSLCSASHPQGIISPILLLLASWHLNYRLRCISLLFGQEHEFEFFNLGVQLVQHVFLHGKHLILHLHLLLRMLLRDLLHFNLRL